MIRKLSGLVLALILVLSSQAGSAQELVESEIESEIESMIEVIDDDASVELPFETADGESLRGRVVVVEHLSDGTVRTRAIQRNSSGEFDIVPQLSVMLRYPQILSVSLGLIIGEESYSGMNGMLIQFEPGVTAGQVAIGYVTMDYWESMPGMAITLKGAVMQTWLSALGVRAGQTYAGMQIDVSSMMIKVSLGIMRKVAGDMADKKWLFVGGIGLGY